MPIESNFLWKNPQPIEAASFHSPPGINLYTRNNTGIFKEYGLVSFDDFWNLPRDFVDDVNYRRGGWSAASKHSLGAGARTQSFYIKRQENQKRFSITAPMGLSTYKYELAAIQRNVDSELPSVQVIAYGFRKIANTSQALIVTNAISGPSLYEINISTTDWDRALPKLAMLGRQLHSMHLHRISHGALYPQHIFIDDISNKIHLIDFERSRVCFSVRLAISRDLNQLLKRLSWMPIPAVQALLSPYLKSHPTLTQNIMSKYLAI